MLQSVWVAVSNILTYNVRISVFFLHAIYLGVSESVGAYTCVFISNNLLKNFQQPFWYNNLAFNSAFGHFQDVVVNFFAD